MTKREAKEPPKQLDLPSAPAPDPPIKVLPMQLRIGDRISDERSEWRVIVRSVHDGWRERRCISECSGLATRRRRRSICRNHLSSFTRHFWCLVCRSRLARFIEMTPECSQRDSESDSGVANTRLVVRRGGEAGAHHPVAAPGECPGRKPPLRMTGLSEW